MKKRIIIFFCFCILCSYNYETFAQVTAVDCSVAVNICTNNNFSVAPAGTGFIDFTTGNNISNPVGNPAGIIPLGGLGCLKVGEQNPIWMIINIQTNGTLEFSMGAGTGAGAQSGCYDWSLWVYNPNTCVGINTNTLAPVRCCWNSLCSGGTGLASAANLPVTGDAKDFGVPLNANCGDKFIMCFSNYSGVTTLVPLNFFGTASVSCIPIPCVTSIGTSFVIKYKNTLFPNPNNGNFKLLIDSSAGSAEIKNGEIILINSLGQKVHEQKIIQGSNEIKTNGLAKGLYNYILLEDKQKIGSGKMILE